MDRPIRIRLSEAGTDGSVTGWTEGENEASQETTQPTQAPTETQASTETQAPGQTQAPTESQAPSQTQAPTESQAPSQTQAPAATTAPTQAVTTAPTEPGPTPLPIPWDWIGTVLLLVLAAASLAALAAVLVKRNRKSPASIPKTEQRFSPAAPGAPQVGKLHQQGARASQQDCFSVTPLDVYPTHGLLAVVADGMGGLKNGDKVSQAAVTAMMNGFFETRGTPEEQLLTLLAQANRAVNELLTPSELNKSGSTIVAGLVREGRFYCLSVGDSHIYLYRDGALYQLNREHVFRRELQLRAINQNTPLGAAWAHPKAGGLTSFLGMGQIKYVDMPDQSIPIRAGDKFLLMTDGVYNALTQEELVSCIGGSAGEGAQLLDQAIRAKGYSNQDNYTAVILAF